MPLELSSLFRGLAILIEAIGHLIIVGACLDSIFRSRSLESVRLKLSHGIVAALGFKTAATLLKAIELSTWTQIGIFTTIVAIRTLIKWELGWQRTRLLASH